MAFQQNPAGGGFPADNPIASHQPSQEIMEKATVFSSIAAGWNQLGEIVTTAQHIFAKPSFDEGMEAAIILAVLGKNFNANGTKEMALDVARVASKCVELRMSGSTHIPPDWIISLERVYRIFYCISDEGISQILPQQMRRDLNLAPVLAFQMSHAIQSSVHIFYVNEFQEAIGELDCFLIVSAIQEKLQKDEDESENPSDCDNDGSRGPSSSAPAA